MPTFEQFRTSFLRSAPLLFIGVSLGACNQVFGFQEGVPYPPDSGAVDADAAMKADVAMTPDVAMTADARGGDDASETGEPDAGCETGYRRCGSDCIPESKCCDAHDCATGGMCQAGVCGCPRELTSAPTPA